MKIDAFTCDFCEEFGSQFLVTNEWYSLNFGIDSYHLCSYNCLLGFVEDCIAKG